MKSQSNNVFGEPIKTFTYDPMTGFCRNGSYDTGTEEVHHKKILS